jgi:prepilin-type N-terminal cleavage/methylation domain-containing protein
MLEGMSGMFFCFQIPRDGREIRAPGHSLVPNFRSRQDGMTLVELLVVLAIIATLAGLIYPAIMDSIRKSEASMAAQRIDAVEKAKVQYRLDNLISDPAQETATMTVSQVSQYLVRLGQPITTDDTLNQGTGGKIHIGSLATTAWFEPNSKNDRTMQLLNQYGVPLQEKSVMTTTTTPGTVAQ